MTPVVARLEALLERVETRRRFPKRGGQPPRITATGPLEQAIEAHVSEPPMPALPPDTIPPLRPEPELELEPMPLTREKTQPRTSSLPPPPSPVRTPSSGGAVVAQPVGRPAGPAPIPSAAEFRPVSVAPPTQSVVMVRGDAMSEATPSFGALLERTLSLRPRE